MSTKYKISLAAFVERFANSTSNSPRILCKGGRTGAKVHSAYAGSSCLDCGHWLKYSASNFAVNVAFADRMDRCEKCFPGEWNERA